jgi:hypothetical protein
MIFDAKMLSPIERFRLDRWVSLNNYTEWVREENGTGMRYSKYGDDADVVSRKESDKVFDPLLIESKHSGQRTIDNDQPLLPHGTLPSLLPKKKIPLQELQPETLDFLRSSFKLCIVLQLSPYYLEQGYSSQKLAHAIVKFLQPVNEKARKSLYKLMLNCFSDFSDESNGASLGKRKRAGTRHDFISMLYQKIYSHTNTCSIEWSPMNSHTIRRYIVFNLDYNHEGQFYNHCLNKDILNDWYEFLVNKRDNMSSLVKERLLPSDKLLKEFYHEVILFKHKDFSQNNIRQWCLNRQCLHDYNSRMLDFLQRKPTTIDTIRFESETVGELKVENTVADGCFRQKLQLRFFTQASPIILNSATDYMRCKHLVIALDGGGSLTASSWLLMLKTLSKLIKDLTQHRESRFVLSIYVFANQAKTVVFRCPADEIDMPELCARLTRLRSSIQLGYPTSYVNCIKHIGGEQRPIYETGELFESFSVKYPKPVNPPPCQLVLLTDGNTASSKQAISSALDKYRVKVLPIKFGGMSDKFSTVDEIFTLFNEPVIDVSGENQRELQQVERERVINFSHTCFDFVTVEINVSSSNSKPSIEYCNGFYLDGQDKEISVELQHDFATEIDISVDGEKLSTSSNYLFSRYSIQSKSTLFGSSARAVNSIQFGTGSVVSMKNIM